MGTELILGQHPGKLTVRLVRDDSALLVATLVDDAGAPSNWPGTPTLEFTASADIGKQVEEFEASVTGAVATWALSAGQVEDIAAISAGLYSKGPSTRVRVTVLDENDPSGRTLFAGKVEWKDSWSSGDRIQRVTFTLPGGPAGKDGENGKDGEDGAPGVGVPPGGTTDQILIKVSGADFDTAWGDQSSGGGGGPIRGSGFPSGAVSIGTEYIDEDETSGAVKWIYTSKGWKVTVGDTGWRNVTAGTFFNGNTEQPPTEGGFLIKRTASGVYVTSKTTYLTWPSDNNRLRIASGFRPRQGQVMRWSGWDTGQSGYLIYLIEDHAFRVISNGAGANPFVFNYSSTSSGWNTEDAWPSTLPGYPDNPPT